MQQTVLISVIGHRWPKIIGNKSCPYWDCKSLSLGSGLSANSE